MRVVQQLIGDLKVISQADKKVSLSYDVPKNGRLSIVIQDQLGRPHFDKIFSISKDRHQLMFSLAALAPGEYHAWITFGEKTAIRALSIPQTKGGFNFRSWMNLFS